MLPGHPTLIALLARDRYESFLQEAEQRRLVREARGARKPFRSTLWATASRLVKHADIMHSRSVLTAGQVLAGEEDDDNAAA